MRPPTRAPTRAPSRARRGAVSGVLPGILPLLLLLLAACGGDPERPNLVLVVVDTLRADHTSLHGYDRETTPAVDRWAEGGTVYERAWAACSWTAPSMNMLLTGQVRIENDGTVRPDQEPLAELLRRAGYRTGAVVANRIVNERLGFDRGFESFDLVPREQAVQGWTADEVVRRGLDWLERVREDEPFFLYLHPFDPHGPYAPRTLPEERRFERRDDPARWEAMRAVLAPEDRDDLHLRYYRGIETYIARYDSEILQVDVALERLFARLERSGLDERTLVVLTSDHGEGLWQRRATPGERPRANAYFPKLYDAHGVQLYSEQVHVPLVLRGPGVPAGRRVAADVSLLDLVPTLVTLLDLPPPRTRGGLHGVDLASDEERERSRIWSLCSRGTTVTARGRWRLHEPRGYRIEKHGARPELYDLALDPGELRPIEDAERIERYRAEVRAFRERHAAEDELAARPREQVELMRALGYLDGAGARH